MRDPFVTRSGGPAADISLDIPVEWKVYGAVMTAPEHSRSARKGAEQEIPRLECRREPSIKWADGGTDLLHPRWGGKDTHNGTWNRLRVPGPGPAHRNHAENSPIRRSSKHPATTPAMVDTADPTGVTRSPMDKNWCVGRRPT